MSDSNGSNKSSYITGPKPFCSTRKSSKSRQSSFLQREEHASESGGNSYDNMVVVVPRCAGAGTREEMKTNSSNIKKELRNHRLPSPLPLRRKLEDNKGRSKLGRKDHLPTTELPPPPPSVCTPIKLVGDIDQALGSLYELQRLLGKGRFSKVYQIRDRKSMQPYALKILGKNTGSLQQWHLDGNRYKIEIGILQICRSHQNIISLHQVMNSPTHVFMILELAAGGDLFDRLKTQGHFSEDRSRQTLKMILSGLSYLHGNGITHRDLKLENLLYKTQELDSTILISDFGLAHARSTSYNSITRGCNCKNSCDHCQGLCDHQGGCGMSTTCGTAEYLSPEMLEGEVYSDKVDVWAVGVVTYAILSGQMPFSDEGVGGKLRARMYDRIKRGEYSFKNEVRKYISLAVSGRQ